MDLRRSGEFAFGIGVFMCGAAFLLLAVERLSAPVLVGVPVAPPIVAAVRQPIVVFRPPKVRKIVAVRRSPRPHRSVVVIVAAAPVASIVRPHPAPPRLVRTRHPDRATAAVVHRPAAKRSPMPRVLAISPKNERTPEPPIGYDDHPALVSSEGPSAPVPTMEPFQVELTTKNLGH